MIVALIAAVADNGVIGAGDRLPWHLPRDLRHFKLLTTGHTVIMGRRTFVGLGSRLLPNRRLVVLSRDAQFRPPAGVEVFGSLPKALLTCADTAFVAGGAAVYAEALPLAQVFYRTRVHGDVAGDVRFPAWDDAPWELLEEQGWPADARHAYALTFQLYARRGGAAPPVRLPGLSA